jgi:hypothetical protein
MRLRRNKKKYERDKVARVIFVLTKYEHSFHHEVLVIKRGN